VRAISFDRFGGPEVLRLTDMPEPAAAAGQIAIGVRYAGVNFAEVMARRGDWDVSLPYVPGLEVAGMVLAAGAGVDEGLVGTTVVAFTGSGGYAEVAVADAALAIPVTAGTPLPLRAAVAAACVLPTAWGVLFGAGRMQAGESVLVHAAAGGVGSVIGQLARGHGAGMVAGVVSTREKAAYAAQFGCWDELLLADDFPADAAAISSGRGFDIICDSVGGSTRLAGLELLAPLGRLVVFGNASASPEVKYGLQRLQETNRVAAGYNVADLAARMPDVYRGHAMSALRLLEQGRLLLDVTDVFPLEQAAAAHGLLESRRTTGKLALKI
jgi:NADPH:quinone reductase